MKVIAKPIDMIAWFEKEGKIHPIRFRIIDEAGNEQVIKIQRIFKVEKEKTAGNVMYKYTCQSVINGTEKRYEIKYELDTCQWMLFKI
jgi:hypothetical protein